MNTFLKLNFFFQLSDSVKSIILLCGLGIMPIIFNLTRIFIEGEMPENYINLDYYTTFLPAFFIIFSVFGLCLYSLVLVIKHKTDFLISLMTLKFLFFFSAGNLLLLMIIITLFILLLPVFLIGLLLLGLPIILFFLGSLFLIFRYNEQLIKNIILLN